MCCAKQQYFLEVQADMLLKKMHWLTSLTYSLKVRRVIFHPNSLVAQVDGLLKVKLYEPSISGVNSGSDTAGRHRYTPLSVDVDSLSLFVQLGPSQSQKNKTLVLDQSRKLKSP